MCIENYFPKKNHSALSKQLENIHIKFCTFKTFRTVKVNPENGKQLYCQLDWPCKKGGSFSLWWTVFLDSLWFSVKSVETKLWILSSFKEVTFVLWFSLFTYYIVIHSCDFSVTVKNNKNLPVAGWIFLLIFFVRSFEVRSSFAEFAYAYCFGYPSVVVFCFVLRRRSAVQFLVFVNFSNVHACFVFRWRSAVPFFCVCQF